MKTIHWEYRIIVQQWLDDEDDEVCSNWSIRAVYYTADGRVNCTEISHSVHRDSDTVEALRADFELQRLAFDKPPLLLTEQGLKEYNATTITPNAGGEDG